MGLGLVGLIGAGAIAFFVARRGPDYDIEVLTVPVAASELTVRISASGSVQPIRTVNVSPTSAGIVKALFVEQGDRVTEGQLIAEMDRDQVEAQIVQNRAGVAEARAQLDDALNGASDTDIAQAQASLASARAQLREAQARLDLAQEDRDRTQSLFERGAVARSALDLDVSESRSAAANVAQSVARVNEAEQRLIDQQKRQ